LAQAHALSLPLTGLHIYNVGTQTGVKVIYVVKKIFQIVGYKVPIDDKGERKGDVPSLVASSEKIEKELRACFMSNDFNPDKLIQKIITIISHNKLRFEGIEIQSCSYTTWGLLYTDAWKFFKNMRKFKNKEVFTIKIR